MSASSWIHLDVKRVKRVTDKAMLLILEDGDEVWIPMSQMEAPDDYDEGDENCAISVSEWVAREKGLL